MTFVPMLAEVEMVRESPHAAAMRTISRRFWLAFWLMVASAIAGWGIAWFLMSEPLLKALGIG